MTLTSCSGERPPRKTATRVSFLRVILYPNPATRLRGHEAIRKLRCARRPAQSPLTSDPGQGVKSEVVRVRGTDLALFHLEGDSAAGSVELIWAHGWGPRTRRCCRSRRRCGGPPGRSSSIFPASAPRPYPRYLGAPRITPMRSRNGSAACPPARRIWVAHSFGCRVGLQLAARHAGVVDGLFLIAAAGLPPQRTAWAQARRDGAALRLSLGAATHPRRAGARPAARRFGSADYRSGRGVCGRSWSRRSARTYAAVAGAVRVPAVLVYGDQDRETPPEIGDAAQQPDAAVAALRAARFRPLDVLTEGRHLIIQLLGELMEQLR